MRIGIIGGGASGLASAWLLEEQHDVTLFEKQDRLGGHAQTVDVEVDGVKVPIDAGFDFFAQRLWPTFCRLLSILDAPVHRYAGTTTLYTSDNAHVHRMPFIRNGRVCWSIFRPDTLSKMVQFQSALKTASRLIEARNTSLTVEAFTEGLPLSRSFKDQFLYPLVQAIWCTEPHDFRRFSAYNAFKYYVCCEVGKFSQFYFNEVIGGSRAYIEQLVKGLKRTSICTGTEIKRVRSQTQRYAVEDGSGAFHEFDHLIVATNAQVARAVVKELDSVETLQTELGKVQYFKGTIAIHGDTRFMPANRNHWSVFNIRHDGTHSALSVWKEWKSRTPVFKSWVTFEPRMPQPLYFTETYDHPKVSPHYFEAQRAVAGLQGINNLWLAGLYTHDIDSHEGAVLSAVKIAQRLSPQSSNLKQLMAP